MHIKQVYLSTLQSVNAVMLKQEDVTEEQKRQIRILFAQEMIKMSFVKKTLAILKDYKTLPKAVPKHLEGQPDYENIEYQIFAEWMKAYADDEKVKEFKKLADTCGMSLIMPE